MIVRRTTYKAPRVLHKREEAVALYLPIGGGAAGRGGSSSGKKNNVGMALRCVAPLGRAKGQGYGQWMIAVILAGEEPQNPENLQKPF